MKTATALALVSAASGAVIEQRQTPTSEFDVTNFSASCQPHSVLCFFGFNVATMTTATSCGLTVQGPDLLPAVGLTGCEDPRFSWSFGRAGKDGGAHALTVTWEATPGGGNLTGSHLIQPAEVVLEFHGSVSDERYVGPANFVISPLQ
ncbi:hypothetical protein PG997_009071 [Apiospora hydei]|uniref:Uncharacterized protein n=1 Tax=Apiospora hydei TaxID=1337664 RepID=A0ABR1VT54_9PEZI